MILLDRLLTHIADEFLSESQSGRGIVDLITTARELQEKCLKQQVGLYQVFID